MNPYKPPEALESPKDTIEEKATEANRRDRSFAMYLLMFVAMGLVIRLSSLIFP